MTLTQALKENMGDPERRTCYQVSEMSVKKKRHEVSQKEGVISFQEVGPDHSSEEGR
jgi:hypothetical protein